MVCMTEPLKAACQVQVDNLAGLNAGNGHKVHYGSSAESAICGSILPTSVLLDTSTSHMMSILMPNLNIFVTLQHLGSL